MVTLPISIQEDYWKVFEVQDSDLEFLYNFLLEIEEPQTTEELLRALIAERIRQEKVVLEKGQKDAGVFYSPKLHFELNQNIIFPTLNFQQGNVKNVRQGNNPELPPFEVIEVLFQNGTTRQFAANYADHALNHQPAININDPALDVDHVMQNYGEVLAEKLSATLGASPDLVKIAWCWFPRSLLVDVNIGHLNLAEALLDMNNGGPLSTESILEQIELPTDVSSKLTEFSLNLALQEDSRFDEVGPAGKILWFLKRLEPDGVQELPQYLRYSPIDFDQPAPESILKNFSALVIDELENKDSVIKENQEATVSLIFPHWRAGTLPLNQNTIKLFPTAYESPRVQFSFFDKENNQRFNGWVVRHSNYVFGLQKWYQELGLMPGSLIQLKRSNKPGEVLIHCEKRRPSREWLKTVLVGADGGIVLALLKQIVTGPYDERMALAVPDIDALDQIWGNAGKRRQNLEQTIISMMRELAKLNPQGHVHALELYASVNLVRRCPPGPILSMLTSKPWASHMGDLYFRLDDGSEEG